MTSCDTSIARRAIFQPYVPQYYKDINPTSLMIYNEWMDVGEIKCDCHHSENCSNCWGDGRCLNCDKYGEHGPRYNMCDTWRFNGYWKPKNTKNVKKVRFIDETESAVLMPYQEPIKDTRPQQLEVQKDIDGNLYTYNEFIDYYGEELGENYWYSSLYERKIKKIANKGKQLYLYYM